MLVGTDVLNFDFYGYDFNSNSYEDFRITSTGFAFDIYHSITQGDDENIAYVSVIKFNSFGADTPWIIKYNFSTRTFETIVSSGIEEPVSLDIDKINNKIYWIDQDMKKMMRANLDGSGMETLGDVNTFLTGWDPVVSVDEVNGKIYFTNGGGNVSVTDINSWDPQDLTTDFVVPGGRIGKVMVDDAGAFLYWTYNLTQEPSYIVKTNLATGTEEKVVQGGDAYIAFDLFEDRMYWTGDFSVVSSANIDGTDVQVEFDAEPFVGDFIMRSSLTTSTHFVADTDNQVLLFPNPASESFALNIDAAQVTELTGTIKIVNGVGQVVRQINKHDFSNRIDIVDLPQGVYYLFLQKSNGQEIVKEFAKI